MARTGILGCGFKLSVLVLWGCTSDSPLKPAGQADAGPDAPRAAADAEVDVRLTGTTDTSSTPEGGTVEVSGTDGRSSDGGVCQSPLRFQSASQIPSMCPGAVLKAAVIPFAPTDSRWSSLYQSCLQGYGSQAYQYACGQLCTAVAVASPMTKYNQGITSCSLDCSQPDSPVLSVSYSDTLCEPSPPDARLDGAPDAGIEDVRVDAPGGVPDTRTGVDALDGGSPPQVVLRNVSAYGNCMPSVAADPIIAFWTVDISGALGTSAQLSNATITVSKGTSIVQGGEPDDPAG